MWIIAQDDRQMAEVEKVHKFASDIGAPTRFLSSDEVSRRESDVPAKAGVLESGSTGIVDSHSFMQYLEGDVQNRGGDIVFHTTVTQLEVPHRGRAGYRLPTKNSDSVEEDVIDAQVLINSAGLCAVDISNKILPKERHRKSFYAK